MCEKKKKKITKKFVADGDFSSSPVVGQNVLRNLAGYLEFFAVCLTFYSFMSQFLSEPITVICGYLFREQLAIG